MKRFVRVRVVSWMFYLLFLPSDYQTNERLLQLFNSTVNIWFYDVYKFVFPQPPFIGTALFEIKHHPVSKFDGVLLAVDELAEVFETDFDDFFCIRHDEKRLGCEDGED